MYVRTIIQVGREGDHQHANKQAPASHGIHVSGKGSSVRTLLSTQPLLQQRVLPYFPLGGKKAIRSAAGIPCSCPASFIAATQPASFLINLAPSSNAAATQQQRRDTMTAAAEEYKLSRVETNQRALIDKSEWIHCGLCICRVFICCMFVNSSCMYVNVMVCW